MFYQIPSFRTSGSYVCLASIVFASSTARSGATTSRFACGLFRGARGADTPCRPQGRHARGRPRHQDRFQAPLQGVLGTPRPSYVARTMDPWAPECASAAGWRPVAHFQLLDNVRFKECVGAPKGFLNNKHETHSQIDPNDPMC